MEMDARMEKRLTAYYAWVQSQTLLEAAKKTPKDCLWKRPLAGIARTGADLLIIWHGAILLPIPEKHACIYPDKVTAESKTDWKEMQRMLDYTGEECRFAPALDTRKYTMHASCREYAASLEARIRINDKQASVILRKAPPNADFRLVGKHIGIDYEKIVLSIEAAPGGRTTVLAVMMGNRWA